MKMKKSISLLLTMLLITASVNIPGALATEVETPVAESVPAQTVPEETLPAQTIPQETVVEEATEPEETEEVEERDVSMIPSLEELPEVSEGYDSVPLYFQTDYPNTMFGRGV